MATPAVYTTRLVRFRVFPSTEPSYEFATAATAAAPMAPSAAAPSSGHDRRALSISRTGADPPLLHGKQRGTARERSQLFASQSGDQGVRSDGRGGGSGSIAAQRPSSLNEPDNRPAEPTHGDASAPAATKPEPSALEKLYQRIILEADRTMIALLEGVPITSVSDARVAQYVHVGALAQRPAAWVLSLRTA